ncbi:MAG: hypothetical protein ABW221_14035, partial [Vicinamibacteria bacterium]
MTRAERIAAVAAALAVALLIATDAVPLLRGPAPYPPEWRWELREAPPEAARYAWPLAAGAALVALAASKRGRPRTVLAAAVPLGVLFALGLLGLEPRGACETLVARVLSRTDTAYYTVAVSEDGRDAGAFLDRHADLLVGMRRTAKHAATHPPGPVLYYRAWIALCERAPALTRAALAAAGTSAEEGPAARDPNTPASVAGAFLGGLGVLVLCALACVPIAALLRALGMDAHDAAHGAALWPLVPGAALMSPQFDQALALPVAGAVALLARATRATGRARVALALAAGAAGFAASFVSYGAVAYVAIGAAAAGVALSSPRQWTQAAAVATGAAAACLAVTAALGHEPLAAARTALAFHREAYTAPRSYGLWLAWNPLDLALFLGAPAAALGLARLAAPPADAAARFRLALAAGIVLLLVSGSVRGEIGRIGVPQFGLLQPAALAGRPRPARDAAG